MIYTARYHSPLGDITLACDGRALTGLWFLASSVFDNKVFGSPSGCDGQRHFGSTLICADYAKVGTEIYIKIREKLLKAVTVKMPFYEG